MRRPDCCFLLRQQPRWAGRLPTLDHSLKLGRARRCSAGVACSKLMAKLVSGLHKPDDQSVILPTDAEVR